MAGCLGSEPHRTQPGSVLRSTLQRQGPTRGGLGARPPSCPKPRAGVLTRLVLPPGGAGPGPALVWCLQAYLKWVAEGGKDQQLPGLELTYQQLFFINYAQVGVSSPLPPSPLAPTPTAGNWLPPLPLVSPHYRVPPGTLWAGKLGRAELMGQEGFLEERMSGEWVWGRFRCSCGGEGATSCLPSPHPRSRGLAEETTLPLPQPLRGARASPGHCWDVAGATPASHPRPFPSSAATPLMRPQVWCGSYRPEFRYIQSIKTDVHSPEVQASGPGRPRAQRPGRLSQASSTRRVLELQGLAPSQTRSTARMAPPCTQRCDTASGSQGASARCAGHAHPPPRGVHVSGDSAAGEGPRSQQPTHPRRKPPHRAWTAGASR